MKMRPGHCGRTLLGCTSNFATHAPSHTQLPGEFGMTSTIFFATFYGCRPTPPLAITLRLLRSSSSDRTSLARPAGFRASPHRSIACFGLSCARIWASGPRSWQAQPQRPYGFLHGSPRLCWRSRGLRRPRRQGDGPRQRAGRRTWRSMGWHADSAKAAYGHLNLHATEADRPQGPEARRRRETEVREIPKNPQTVVSERPSSH